MTPPDDGFDDELDPLAPAAADEYDDVEALFDDMLDILELAWGCEQVTESEAETLTNAAAVLRRLKKVVIRKLTGGALMAQDLEREN